MQPTIAPPASSRRRRAERRDRAAGLDLTLSRCALELLGTDLTVDAVLERMLGVIREGGVLEPHPDMDAAMRDRYHHHIERMRQRNRGIRKEKEDKK